MKTLLLSIVLVILCCTNNFAQCTPKSVKIRAGSMSPFCDSTKLDWANWSSINGTLALGSISPNLNVTVTKPTGSLFSTPVMYSGSFFPSSYNVPINQTSIANNVAGVFTYCFSAPVSDPVVALASIGRQGVSVPINTSVPYQVVWQGISMQYPSCTQLIGEEGYTIIKFPGVHSCISFDYLTSENWCNIAFGVLDTNCQTSGPVTYCSGSNGSNVLTAYATGGTPPYSYNWSPSTGLNSTSSVSVIASPTVTTKYYVSVTDATNAFIGIDSITLNVIPKPVVTVNSATECYGNSATLTASGAFSYLWSNNSISNTITVTPLGTTSYTVTGSSSGCSSTAVATITVNPTTATYQTIYLCAGQTFSIGSQTYTTPGIYSDVLLSSKGCDSTIYTTIIVHPAVFTNQSISLCSGNTITVGAHTYSLTGNYLDTLVAHGGCDSIINTNLIVNAIPVVTVNSATVCNGQSAILTASGGISYVWGNSSTANSLTVSPSTTTSYTVTGTSLGCSSTAVATVNVKPIFTTNQNINLCSGQSVTVGLNTYTVTGVYSDILTSSNGCDSTITTNLNVSTIILTTQNITLCSGNSVTIGFNTYSTSGSYYDTLTTQGGCDSVVNTNLTINPSAVVTVNSTTICVGELATLSASVAILGGTYSWSPIISSNFSITDNPNSTSTYTVTYSLNGCSQTASGTIYVNTVPSVSVNSAIICERETATLAAYPSISGGTYSWNPLISNNSTVTDNPTSTTIYSVIYTLNGCSATATGTIVVKPVPSVTINSTTYNISTTLSATPSISGGTYLWNPDGATNQTISVTPIANTTYTVTYTLDGCSTSSETIVQYTPEFVFYIPNAFTPDGDGLNDVFNAKGEEIAEFKMEIFNRWGELIYNTIDFNKGWDGRTKSSANEIAKMDVYVYKIDVKDLKNKSHSYIGNVNLIKQND